MTEVFQSGFKGPEASEKENSVDFRWNIYSKIW